MLTIKLTPGESVNIFRYMYFRLRLKFSQTARDEMEGVQASLEFAQELLTRADAKRHLEQKDLTDSTAAPQDVITPYWTDSVEDTTTEGRGIEVVEYDPDALDYLIQLESKEIQEWLKQEGWASS